MHVTPILGLNQSSLSDWMTFLFAEMHRPPAVGAAALGTAAVKRSLAERAQGTSVLRVEWPRTVMGATAQRLPRREVYSSVSCGFFSRGHLYRLDKSSFCLDSYWSI